MIKKIIFTIIAISLPIAGMTSVVYAIRELIEATEVINIAWLLGSLILMMAPAHFMWKGTKLVPILSIFPIRVVSMIAGIIIAPLGIFFSLWGIWIKS